MKNLEKFIRVSEDSYIININYFLGGHEFNHDLLELVLSFARKRYNINNVCDILEFNNLLFRFEIPFIYPYVDMDLSFNHIYSLYFCTFNSNFLYLYINKKI